MTCSDCHDPHSAALKTPGDGICAQCHAPAKYEGAAHRHHADVLQPPSCAAYPYAGTRRYMVVDRRHDHGFRIPRPDLSIQPAAPNACNDCHHDKEAAWAARHIETWFGPERQSYQAFAPAFHAAWSQEADAARTALGNFFARQADPGRAESEFRTALRLDPSFAPAAINLSDLYRQLGRDGDGERVLRETLSRSPRDASLHHALGLTLVRQKRSEAALEELRQAALLDPARARYAYVYAVGLNTAGRHDDALAVLNESLQANPNNRELLSAAIHFSREKGT